jgi:hypothetical protein
VRKTKNRGSAALYLLVNSLSWFTLTLVIIGNLLEHSSLSKILLVAGPYFLGLIASAIIGGTLLYRKLRRRAVLLSWVLAGVATCLLYAFASTSSLPSLIIASSMLLGASIGVGIPTCFFFFATQTKTESRGRIGAVVFFVIQLLSALILFLIDQMGTESVFLILAVWRLLGIAGVLFYEQPLQTAPKEGITSSLSILKERTFILYFLAWLLFTLVNFIEEPVLESFFGAIQFSNYVLATALISSFSAFIGGVLCDLKGRKITGILGFAILGIGYAFLSFLSGGVTKGIGQILYTACDGTAWGILYVTFVFVVWGDQSEGKIREKYYLWGSMPFLISGFIEMLIRPSAGSIPIGTSFPLASFFLFIAVLPLIYAPETLPEKAMKDRDLKSYAEKALEQAAKQEEKKRGKNADDAEVESRKSEGEAEEPSEYEEARKLAEKYY